MRWLSATAHDYPTPSGERSTVSIIVRDVSCQRSRLPIFGSEDGRTWVCPWCSDRELYRRLDPGEWAHKVVAETVEDCRIEFGAVDDGHNLAVWLGDSPETVFEPDINSWHIYIDRCANYWRTMFQGTHEAFHRACSPPNQSHWTHELLAVHYSSRWLDQHGHGAYAATCRTQMAEGAPQCPPESLVSLAPGQYPHAAHDRAYVLGEGLLSVVGWDAIKPLGVVRNADDKPSCKAWLDTLSADQQAAVRGVVPSVLADD